MPNKFIKYLFLFAVLLFLKNAQSQILFDMGNYRNLAYISNGYNGAYENTTIGIARRDYVKFLKREIVGVLDIAFPVTEVFFTKHGVRKGFQTDLYRKNEFKLPFMFASSSIVRNNSYYKFHDVTAEFSITPGFYKKKYSIALDLRYELIVFRLIQYHPDYYKDDQMHEFKPGVRRHWEEPFFSIAKVGFMAGWNLKHCVFYLRSGYERNPFIDFNFHNFLPGYALIGFGYKFGTKPFKKKPGEDGLKLKGPAKPVD